MYVVRPSSPTGPRACSLPVEMPTSAPSPKRKPSAKRVEQFQKTSAESTAARNSSAAARSSVTIASVWCEPWRFTWATASASDGTTRTESVRSRYSSSQSASVAGSHEGRKARVAGSPRSRTPRAAIASPSAGRKAGAAASWTSSVSMELQVEGACVLASTARRTAMADATDGS